MVCFQCVLWGRGGWFAEGEDHSRTKPLAGHQPCGFWPHSTSLSRICSASLLGEGSKVILLDTAEEPGAAVHKRAGIYSHNPALYLLFCHFLPLLILMFLISCWISAAPLPIILLTSQLCSSCFFFHVLLVTSASCLDSYHFLLQLLQLLLDSGRALQGSLLPALGSWE